MCVGFGDVHAFAVLAGARQITFAFSHHQFAPSGLWLTIIVEEIIGDLLSVGHANDERKWGKTVFTVSDSLD